MLKINFYSTILDPRLKHLKDLIWVKKKKKERKYTFVFNLFANVKEQRQKKINKKYSSVQNRPRSYSIVEV